jgi:phosphonate transport system substrate-binding protein
MRRRYAIGIIWYHDYNWTVRGDLDPALVKKITQAFLKLDPTNPADKELLELQCATRYIPTEPANYEGIDAAARNAGLLK